MNSDFWQLLAASMLALVFVAVLLATYWIAGQQWIRSTPCLLANLLLAPGATVITTVIRNDIALSLGLVGALSIVRFRNPVRSPAELTLYFTSLVIGIACTVNTVFPVVILSVAAVALLLIQLIAKVSPTWDWGLASNDPMAGFLLSVDHLDSEALHAVDFDNNLRMLESMSDNGVRIILRLKSFEAAESMRDQLLTGDGSGRASWTITRLDA